ncbi:MAG: YihY family inner membrane protein [Elusimicrobia bacterium]|nr:YihY family inner membrane protein [Elusimicrobiota bacterium]MBD3412056.1 YihY family inner membrane protein [Elusimicrobiota bacterium]
MNPVKKFVNFFKVDIWKIRAKSLSRSRFFLLKLIRIILLVARGFNEDKIQLRALALSFYSLLSIIPVLAMVFGIAKGFGIEKMLEKRLMDILPNQEQLINHVTGFVYNLLENTKGSVVTGFGLVILLWIVIKVLSNIESSFNDIWGIKHARGFTRKFSDYLAAIIICMLLIVLSGSVNVMISNQFLFLSDKFHFMQSLHPAGKIILTSLSYGFVWAFFAFIYMFMPNTRVKVSSAVLAGIVAGSLYKLVQFLYVSFQVGVVRYNAIYGSFAAVPLFLIWLLLCWMIVFFGAEISFAYQNVDMFELDHDCLHASFQFKKLLSLRITHLVIKNFISGAKPLTASHIAHEIGVPIRLVRQTLFELAECGIVSEVNIKEDKETGFQPARDIKTISINSIINALERRGVNNLPIVHTREVRTMEQAIRLFQENSGNLPQNVLLKDL